MKEIKLKALVRENKGKGAARKIRASGNVPGVAYGEGIEPILLSVSDYEFTRILTGAASGSMLIDLEIEGLDSKKVIVKEVQMDPVVNSIVSVDFKVISMDKEIDVLVPIILSGTPEGVKNSGGILQTIRRDVKIACLPDKIPANVTVDVTEMNIGDTLHFEDLETEDFKVLSNPKVSICTVVAPTVIKEKKAAGEGEEVEGEEGAVEAAEGGEEGEAKGPEVITEKKEE